MRENPKDWSPALEAELRESMMTVKRAKMHDVKYYDDDTGHGLTACGLRVGPWDVTWSGQFTCIRCIRAARAFKAEKKSWEKA
jgi:hypothetical protein